MSTPIIHTQPNEHIIVYLSTRNLYPVLPAAYNSLLAYNPDVNIYLLIEDDRLPYPTPPQITCVNVSGQTIFPHTGPNYTSSFTYMILLKAALPKLFPDADRLLILDVDTIVHDSLTDLFSYDLSHAYYAAVTEPNGTKRKATPYANFGIVLLNLARLRTSGKDDAIIEDLNSHRYPCPEQDAFCKIVGNRFDPLPSAYNVTPLGFTAPSDHVIVEHFAGIKNWSSFPIVQYWLTHTTDEFMKEGDTICPINRTAHP